MEPQRYVSINGQVFSSAYPGLTRIHGSLLSHATEYRACSEIVLVCQPICAWGVGGSWKGQDRVRVCEKLQPVVSSSFRNCKVFEEG